MITVMERGVPHDAAHEFLCEWYPLDEIAVWIDHLRDKDVPFDLVKDDRKHVYMIYKHLQICKSDGTIKACCQAYDPKVEGRENELFLRPTSRRALGIA